MRGAYYSLKTSEAAFNTARKDRQTVLSYVGRIKELDSYYSCGESVSLGCKRCEKNGHPCRVYKEAARAKYRSKGVGSKERVVDRGRTYGREVRVDPVEDQEPPHVRGHVKGRAER